MVLLVKTTVNLDDALLRLAKRRAAEIGVPLRAFIEDALRARLAPRADRREKLEFDLPVVRGTAPPAVDVADRDALYDLMERDRSPSTSTCC
jgi:hypothetical protein